MNWISIETILVASVVTFYVTYTDVFEGIRQMGQVFHCPLCLGFWVGAIHFILFTGPWNYGALEVYYHALVHGFFSGMAAFVIYLLVEMADTYVDQNHDSK